MTENLWTALDVLVKLKCTPMTEYLEAVLDIFLVKLKFIAPNDRIFRGSPRCIGQTSVYPQ